jgi:hypothetical protein
MTGKVTCSGLLMSLTLVVLAGWPGSAAAQQARLYEVVENLDGVRLQTTGHRVSSWTAEGTADAGSPFCPLEVLPPGADSCTITAFGTDDIDLTALASGATVVGTVWANIVAVANLDNVVDGPELAAFSGQITGTITVRPDTPPSAAAEMRGKRAMVGPAIPLIYIREGKFFADAVPVVRTSPPTATPNGVVSATFDSTFRLPFTLASGDRRERPERGRRAFYLGDDGRFIRVDKEDECALGFPLMRAEVYFR